ncbi:MAG TPA: hypothetical protein VMT17_03800 [Anaeromyxobacteraceae bacterium]|nr:hypothetical protein [Anaeromyxobacteraceae bacterium]
MRARSMAMALLAVGSVACSEQCKAPDGCLSVARVQGACQCQEWQVLSVENVPAKFLLLNVLYQPPGAFSSATYGPQVGPGASPQLRSEVGSRWRSVVRTPDGAEHVAALRRFDLGSAHAWFSLVGHNITATSGAVSLDPSSGLGIGAPLDVPDRGLDSLLVWVNPLAKVTTDYAGNTSIDWTWSTNCFGLPCAGAVSLLLSVDEITGTNPPTAGSAPEAFLASLTDAERSTLLAFHPLYDPPGRDPATLATDQRFYPVQGWIPQSGVSSGLNAHWMSCGASSDSPFAVLAQTEIPFSGGTLLVQYSVQAVSSACEPQDPVVWVSSNEGCQLTAQFYLDLAFGTVLGVPTSAETLYGAGCTHP